MLQVLANTDMVQCMSGVEIPSILPNIVHMIVLIIKIAVPIGLIIFGMMDLGKAVMASKEDEIKKAQQLFIKRIIAAVLVFFVVSIVQLTFSLLNSADESEDLKAGSVSNCIDCFLNGAKECRIKK